MAEHNLECAASTLHCAENTNACFEDDLDCNELQNNQPHNQEPLFIINRSDSLIDLPLQSEERVREMVEKERDHLPRDDYLKRLRSGDLDLSVRRQALDWICKGCAHYSFRPQSICLSVNYLDRFLSVHELPRGKAWTVQLLAVSCLSLAAKVEETEVPQSVDLQVGEPKFVFEAKTIQKMELLVLSTLRWRMLAFTPCSFIDYFLCKMNQDPSTLVISRSVQLILSTIKGVDFLEFSPSEIAAAVAISVSREMQAVDIHKAMPCFIHVQKERVLKCVELIKDLSLISGSAKVANASASSVPQSPIGVLDAACLSYKSNDITVGSCATSSDSSQDINKKKQDRT
ncbi:Cyclin_N domain-containing protein/Cyclin_C domain-containing protein [Cephalotus follicularis]|uniref:B-like cyclin n=1 Tax=Cephalotus follicularis TaxID=3775 RepID=A0A1Q3BJB3_CEPFO|nr:Cyclin_N domain-containing protein/Cyclin_C domain-containing protein [Cephalotus follicularis]